MDIPLSNDFTLPSNKSVGANRSQDPEKHCVYLCGNSLGALSSRSRTLVKEELDAWASHAVVGHFSHPNNRQWTEFGDLLHPLCAEVVGAKEKEVVVMGTLTANLHLLMSSFYKPTPSRYKILCEAKAFPSDQYAFASQAVAHGFDPNDAIIELWPREGEFCLREEDIIDVITKEGSSIALVLFSGVQYYTGQWFPMESITQKAKEQGCICGWDLAHAVGNVPLSLHDWNVDFAVWCTYKYLNSGPGGVAGLFVHEKWDAIEKPKYAGWWGHKLSTRFDMPSTFSPIEGAQGFQQSNPSILALASLLGSLQIFKEAGMMPRIRERSVALTSLLETLLVQSPYFIAPKEAASTNRTGFTILTPTDPGSRGAQLSLSILPNGSGLMQKIFNTLVGFGVIGDERQPDVIRLAPAPLYNTSKDCEDAVQYLNKAFDELLG